MGPTNHSWTLLLLVSLRVLVLHARCYALVHARILHASTFTGAFRLVFVLFLFFFSLLFSSFYLNDFCTTLPSIFYFFNFNFNFALAIALILHLISILPFTYNTHIKPNKSKIHQYIGKKNKLNQDV